MLPAVQKSMRHRSIFLTLGLCRLLIVTVTVLIINTPSSKLCTSDALVVNWSLSIHDTAAASRALTTANNYRRKSWCSSTGQAHSGCPISMRQAAGTVLMANPSAPNDSATSADDVWKCAAQGEAAAVAGLRELRLQGDDPRASTQSSLKVLVDGVAAAEGQELLITEASVILQRCPRLAEAAEAGTLSAALAAAATSTPRGSSEYLLEGLEREVVGELYTAWFVAVKKWRQKALAVEKYRNTNPTANAAVYTYMVNCCLRQGMWEVAYDALTYAGLMTAGPFFVSQKDLGFGSPSVILDMDKLACYIAEKILDMDLESWRRRGGDTSVPNAVGNSRPGVGVEERNFSQDEDSVTHLAALRVQDMTLAAARVALRKIRTEFGASDDIPADASLVVLCSATTNALYLGELLLPRRAMNTLFILDFADSVVPDDEMGKKLRSSDAGEIANDLGLLPSGRGSVPLVISGDALRAWAAQEDYARVE